MNKCISQIAMLALLTGMISCGKKVPKDIIQPDAMENLLYDYHLASTVANDLPYSDHYKKGAYLKYVFEKHHVTEAEFDSSMVWYTRNSKELATIYQNLQQRFEASELQLKAQGNRQGTQTAVFLSGDTVDIWQDRSLYWLSASPLTNKVTFDLKADTTFKPKDAIALMADFHFMPQIADAKAVMALNFYFDNDSVQGLTQTVSGSGTQRLYLQPDSAYNIKNISGFIYYTAGQNSKGSVLLNQIRLMRYHDTGKESTDKKPKEVEKIAAESIEMQESNKEVKQKASEKMKPMKLQKMESVE